MKARELFNILNSRGFMDAEISIATEQVVHKGGILDGAPAIHSHPIKTVMIGSEGLLLLPDTDKTSVSVFPPNRPPEMKDMMLFYGPFPDWLRQNFQKP